MNKTEFEQLPITIQEEVKSMLKAYDYTNIWFENGKYNYSDCIKSYYAPDHKFIGHITKDDIYTKDEQIINYVESFHAYPHEYKGNRDYKMLNEVGHNWNVKFKFDEKHNIVRV